MVRRLLFLLACVAGGAGLAVVLSPVDGAGTTVGVVFLGLVVLGAAAGSRWGPGPLARVVPVPMLAWAGLAMEVLCVMAVALLLWRPVAGAGLPYWAFLCCMATAGLLMILVGRMRPDEEVGPAYRKEQ